MVFTNADRNYPIRFVADNVPTVSQYEHKPKGIDRNSIVSVYPLRYVLFPLWLRERKVRWPLIIEGIECCILTPEAVTILR